ncbi:MAG: hypothetical protein PF904_15920 [Kiritimatiellae bacterium]|jgi:hypothetical protein|nr:hypothetical protein [Kiritimatiellia bacterium]
MFKKILLVILILVGVIVIAEIYAKDVPFVKKTREVVMTQIQKLDDGPVGKQWDKVTAYFKRLDKKANRKKAQDTAMSTKPPASCPVRTTSRRNGACQSPKTGIKKSESRRLWADEKGVYNWKDDKHVYD